MTISPLGLAHVQEGEVAPGDAGEAGHDGELRLDPPAFDGFLASSPSLRISPAVCEEQSGAGQVGGWREWAVQGCAVVGWIKRRVHDLLERCDHQA